MVSNLSVSISRNGRLSVSLVHHIDNIGLVSVVSDFLAVLVLAINISIGRYFKPCTGAIEL